MKNLNSRVANYPVDDVFLKRYSPRAMSGEAITKEELMTLFEAARWAPSSSNRQPWRFVYAMRDTPEFEKLFSFLIPFNQDWCKNAGALIVTISDKNKKDGAFSRTHSFDTGAAWENFALQAQSMGLIAHGMSGIHYDLIKEQLSILDDYQVEMMIAVGKHGKVEDLPEALQAREKPSDRKPLEKFIFEGKFTPKN
ncbi:MAG: nitroreductase family protein [Patescibacteria group bacterium]